MLSGNRKVFALLWNELEGVRKLLAGVRKVLAAVREVLVCIRKVLEGAGNMLAVVRRV